MIMFDALVDVRLHEPLCDVFEAPQAVCLLRLLHLVPAIEKKPGTYVPLHVKQIDINLQLQSKIGGW